MSCLMRSQAAHLSKRSWRSGLPQRRSHLWRAFASSANPLLDCIAQRSVPPFKQLAVAHIEPAIKQLAAEHEQNLSALENHLVHVSDTTWADVYSPLEEVYDPLERAWGIVSHLLSVRNAEDLRTVHSSLQQQVVELFTKTSQSQVLFDSWMKLRHGNSWQSLSSEQQRVAELYLKNAQLSGIGLKGEQRERFNSLKLRIAELSTKFGSNLLDATKAFALTIESKDDVQDLPMSLLEMYSQSARSAGATSSTPEDGPWRVTLDPPSYTEFMKYSSKRSLRQELYHAFIKRASDGEFDNRHVIEEILSIRREMAQLLGFDTYAELSVSRKMAGAVAEVEEMHEKLLERCMPLAEQELHQLATFAVKNGQNEDLAPWDLAYWSEKLKTHLYDFNDESIRPYFPLERVLQGLFDLTENVFGVKIEPADGQAETWNADVRFFHVRRKDSDGGEILASFFLDPYSRPQEKNGGAWMNVCMNRSATLGPAGGLRIPVAYLVCNQSAPIGDRPSLMSFREVETLFHEFGHGLQHMLTTVDYSMVAGISGIEWDAVELPSQMMENFCYDEATLQMISGHYKTGAPLPQALFEKIKAARLHMCALGMLRQLSFGALDMHLHHQYTGEEDSAFDVQKRILSRHSLLPVVDTDRFLCSFSHIFAGGYAAGYYSYKWAEVLAWDAFEPFAKALEEDPETRAAAVARVGKRFRDTILGQGGSAHPLTVFTDFRGRPPALGPLLQHYKLDTASSAKA